VFTATLRSNEREVDNRKDSSSIIARVRFRGNVFTELLPSSEPFRLSGVMSQYQMFFLAAIIIKRGSRTNSEKDVLQCHFVHHRSHMTSHEIKSEPRR
jgi:hypothetical protein